MLLKEQINVAEINKLPYCHRCYC